MSKKERDRERKKRQAVKNGGCVYDVDIPF